MPRLNYGLKPLLAAAIVAVFVGVVVMHFSVSCAPSHYDTLQITQDATRTEIRNAYRHQMKQNSLHMPDKYTGEVKRQKEKEFHRLVEAYKVLEDDTSRAAYLQELTDRSEFAKFYCDSIRFCKLA